MKPPYARKPVLQVYLNTVFQDGGWEERLKSCKKIEYYNQSTPVCKEPFGTRTIGYEYYENGIFIALVFEYRRTDGTIGNNGRRSPKMLLIEDIYHYV